MSYDGVGCAYLQLVHEEGRKKMQRIKAREWLRRTYRTPRWGSSRQESVRILRRFGRSVGGMRLRGARGAVEGDVLRRRGVGICWWVRHCL